MADGRRYLEARGPGYDLIVIDAFKGDQHPSHLFSREALQAAKRRLNSGGVIALNIIGFAYGRNAALRQAIEKTLRDSFLNVRVLAANQDLDIDRSYVNLTFFASDTGLTFRRDPKSGRPVLAAYFASVKDQVLDPVFTGKLITDDFNPVDSLNAPAFAAIRRRLLKVNREIMAL